MNETATDSLAYVTRKLAQIAKHPFEEDGHQSDGLFQRITEGGLLRQLEVAIDKKNQFMAALLECGQRDITVFEQVIQAIANLPYPPSVIYSAHMPGADWGLPLTTRPDAPDPLKTLGLRADGQTSDSVSFSNRGQLRHHISAGMTGPPALSGSYMPPTGEDTIIPSMPLSDSRALTLVLKITETHLSALVLHCVLDGSRPGAQSLTDIVTQMDTMMLRHGLGTEVKKVEPIQATQEPRPERPKEPPLPFPDLRVASGEKAPVELTVVMNIVSRYLDRMTQELLPQHAKLYKDLLGTLILEGGTLSSAIVELWTKISASDQSSLQRWEVFVTQKFAEILNPHMLEKTREKFIDIYSRGNPRLDFQTLDTSQRQEWRQYMYARTIIVNSLVGMMCSLRMRALGMTETIVFDPNMPVSNVFRTVATDVLNAQFPEHGGEHVWNTNEHNGYQEAVRGSFASQIRLLEQTVDQTLQQIPLESISALRIGASSGGGTSIGRRFF